MDLVDLIDLGLEDVERLTMSFVVIEGGCDEEYVGEGAKEGVFREKGDGGHGQKPPPAPQGSQLPRQCLNSSIHHADAGRSDTNHAECIDSVSTATTTSAIDSDNNSNRSNINSDKSRWGAFSLLPIISHRPSTTTTTTNTSMSDDNVRDTAFVAGTTAALATTSTALPPTASIITITTTATLAYCDSADEDCEQLHRHLPEQVQLRQQWHDHVAIPSRSRGDNNYNNNDNNNKGTPVVRGKQRAENIAMRANACLPYPLSLNYMSTTPNGSPKASFSLLF